jgi:cell wall-active antibiotic response 4TMS protein YvqF/B-box zinc finger protein
MNCANHADQSAVAYCRTCGKALCAKCTRDVRGVIYCENCLASRLEGTLPPAAAIVPSSGAASTGTPYSGGGPNPAVAGILAGFFPFGVGAVYTSQYAKGLAHLVIFVLLIMGMNRGESLATICAFMFAFFYVYQIIDAVRSAKAIQAGQPAPDPFGLAQTFGAGERVDTSKVPVGAVVLILLGIVFLLRSVGLMGFEYERYWPVILIVIGVWLFARRWGLVGECRGCQCERCRTRHLMGPAILVTVGVLELLDNISRVGWHRTWPVILLVIGVVKLVQNNASREGHIDVRSISGGTPPPASPPNQPHGQVQPPSSEVGHV